MVDRSRRDSGSDSEVGKERADCEADEKRLVVRAAGFEKILAIGEPLRPRVAAAESCPVVC